MSDPVRLALVGCGWISGAHVKGYKDLKERGCGEFEVTACCDRDRAKASEKAAAIAAFQGKKPAVFGSVEELIASGAAQAADLCLPHAFHHQAALPLLDSGLHVLLEKPLGITLKAGRRIIQAAGKAKRILATAENVRRHLSCRAARWVIREGLLGEVWAGHVVRIFHEPMPIEKEAFKWRAIKLLTGGAMILDSGAHFSDMMLFLFGPPDEVFCRTRTFDLRTVEGVPHLGQAQVDVEDAWNAIITFPGGMTVNWVFSRFFPGPVQSFGNYYGSKGMLKDLGWPLHPFQGGFQLIAKDGTVREAKSLEEAYLASLSQEERQRLFPYDARDGFALEIYDFVRAIREGGPVELDGEAGQAAKALSLACYESAALGQPVRYADVLNGNLHAYQDPIDAYWGI